MVNTVLTRVPLDSNEKVLAEGRQSPALIWLGYIVTLGLIEFWRRARVTTLTDRRLIIQSGIVTKSDRSLPLSKIQDVTVKSQIGFDRLFVTTAGGFGGVITSPWMKGGTARRMADLITAGMN